MSELSIVEINVHYLSSRVSKKLFERYVWVEGDVGQFECNLADKSDFVGCQRVEQVEYFSGVSHTMINTGKSTPRCPLGCLILS